MSFVRNKNERIIKKMATKNEDIFVHIFLQLSLLSLSYMLNFIKKIIYSFLITKL